MCKCASTFIRFKRKLAHVLKHLCFTLIYWHLFLYCGFKCNTAVAPILQYYELNTAQKCLKQFHYLILRIVGFQFVITITLYSFKCQKTIWDATEIWDGQYLVCLINIKTKIKV